MCSNREGENLIIRKWLGDWTLQQKFLLGDQVDAEHDN